MPHTSKVKQSPCCARLTGKITQLQGQLGTLARRAAYHDQRGHDITNLQTRIEETKVAIETAKRVIVDHEAEHAGEAA